MKKENKCGKKAIFYTLTCTVPIILSDGALYPSKGGPHPDERELYLNDRVLYPSEGGPYPNEGGLHPNNGALYPNKGGPHPD